MDCLFCKIVEKKQPAKILYEDDDVLAFEDISPQAPTHVLIIPKKHIATTNDIEVSDLKLVGAVVYRASELAKELGIAERGYRLVFNCNQHAGQAVFHIHCHLLGGRRMQWPPG
jgi:histidine triad (HIT) family protein